MMNDELLNAGAFALYRAENPHRVDEFSKRDNAAQAIAADFETYKSRYLRKFQDIHESLVAAGLSVTRAA